MSVGVFVFLPDNKNIHVTIDQPTTMTIEDLKHLISPHMKVAESQFSLSKGGKVLRDNMTVAESSITNESTINANMGLNGGCSCDCSCVVL